MARWLNSWMAGISFCRWLFLPPVYCLLSTFSSEAQSPIIKYARSIIDTLAAPGMHGRGYVNKGDSIAADFLKKEYEKSQVSTFRKQHLQSFSLSVNTFFEKQGVKINDHEASCGSDYIIKSNSKSESGTFPVLELEKYDLNSKKDQKKFHKQKKNSFVFLWDTSGFNERNNGIINHNFLKAKGVIVGKKKLTMGVSQTQSDFSCIELTSEKIPSLFHSIEIQIKTNLIKNYQSQNVVGYIPGTQYPDSFIVFSAHYDHLGRMGKDVYFPGANDNASGCAMLLSLAKYYAEHPPKYSVAFMAFGAEEVGLLGSKYYVENPLFPLKRIKFLVNMDIMGTGDEGIKVVNATEHKKEFDLLLKINEEKKLLPSIQPRGKAKNSDHYYFEEAGVKTFFIYTLGGIKAYHDIYDRPETLPLTEFEDIYKLLIEFTDSLAK